jgi:copper chaperone
MIMRDLPALEAAHRYAVSGLTCGHCVAAVTAELTALAGVTDVHVDLVAGDISTLTVVSEPPIDDGQVETALTAAGDYRLV